MSRIIRWGIMATGNIAHQFARGLRALNDAELVAVGSRSQVSAEAFGDEFDVPRRHGSYEALVSNPEVDAIYVSTPHVYHLENTLQCIENGKAVLCEKPMGLNADQAREMRSRAHERGVFLMEAMWSRFFPAIVRLEALIREGTIGDVCLVKAGFCFKAKYDPRSRLFDPALGGGALLDIGIYPLMLAFLAYGHKPERIASTVSMAPTGVDEQSALALSFGQGRHALLATSLKAHVPSDAMIVGTRGRIRIPRYFHPRELFLHVGDHEEHIEFEVMGNGYGYEAAEVGRALRTGAIESDVWPLSRTIEILETMDALRHDWGLRYPME